MSTQDSESILDNKVDANKVDNEASNIAKNIVELGQNTNTKASAVEQNISAKPIQPKPIVQRIIAPAKPHLSIVNGETKQENNKSVPSPKKKGFNIPFFGNKNSSKVKLSSGSKINKKFALIPIALIAVFGSYLIINSFAASPPMQGNDGLFTPLDPVRILDTRTSTDITKGNPIGANQTIDVQVTGKGGIPAEYVDSVVLNVTAVVPSSAGHTTIWSSDSNMPTTSNLNFNTNQSVANSVTVKVGKDGKVKLYNSGGNTNYIFDVAGYYSTSHITTGDKFTPLNPVRIFDNIQVGADTIDVQVTGKGGIPSDNVHAVVLNVTAVVPSTTGYASLWASGLKEQPKTSNINFYANQSVANSITVKVGADGKVRLHNSSAGNTNYIIDVAGYYSTSNITTGNTFTTLTPSRILDTRTSTDITKGNPVGANQTIDVQVTGKGGIPADNVQAVVLNVAAILPTATGHSTVWSSDTDKPTTSNLNFNTNQSVANSVTVKVGANGKVKLYSGAGHTNYIIDVVGYYSNKDVPLIPPTDPKDPLPEISPATTNDPKGDTYTLQANDYIIAKNEQVDLFKRGILDAKLIESSHLNKIINNKNYKKIIFPKLTTVVNGKVVDVPWQINPIFITRDDLTIEFSKGTIVQAKTNHPDATGLINSTRGNKGIKIEGNNATLKMNRDDFPPIYNKVNLQWSSSEFRGLIVFRAVKDSSINNLNLEGAAGDGITIGSYDKYATPYPYNTTPPAYKVDNIDKNPYVNYNITINNVHINNVARNGISAGNVDGLNITNSFISRTNGKTIAGTGIADRKISYEKQTDFELGNNLNYGPWAGIDFEPNYALEPLSNIVIDKTKFLDNTYGAINVVLSTFNQKNLKQPNWGTLPLAHEENKVRIPSGKETYESYSKNSSNDITIPPIDITVKNSIMGMSQSYYDSHHKSPNDKSRDDSDDIKIIDGSGLANYIGPNYIEDQKPKLGGNISGKIEFINCGFNQLPKALNDPKTNTNTPLHPLPALAQNYRPGVTGDTIPSITIDNITIDQSKLIKNPSNGSITTAGEDFNKYMYQYTHNIEDPKL